MRYSKRTTKRPGRGQLKNKFEGKLQALLEAQWGKGNTLYEKETLEYRVEETRKYTPDFKLKGSNLYVEGKGKFTFQDRKKMLYMKEQYPKLRFHMFFVSADKPLYKGSKSSYGDWCDKHGIAWSDQKRGLPEDWK
jgi:Phage endonuclease I